MWANLTARTRSPPRMVAQLKAFSGSTCPVSALRSGSAGWSSDLAPPGARASGVDSSSSACGDARASTSLGGVRARLVMPAGVCPRSAARRPRQHHARGHPPGLSGGPVFWQGTCPLFFSLYLRLMPRWCGGFLHRPPPQSPHHGPARALPRHRGRPHRPHHRGLCVLAPYIRTASARDGRVAVSSARRSHALIPS